MSDVRRTWIIRAAFSILVMGMAAILVAPLIIASNDVRGDFIDRTVGGIEVGYLCQKRGWDEDQCKSDFRSYMAKAKANRK